MQWPALLVQLVRDAQADGLWWEAFALALSVAVAWTVARWFRKHHAGGPVGRFALVVPVVMCLCVFFAQSVLSISEPVPLLRLALAMLLAWTFSRWAAQLLANMFPHSVIALWFSRVLRWGGWLVAVLVISDWMSVVTTYLDSLYVPIGKHKTSVQSLLEGTVSVVVTVMAALWLSRVLESRLMGSVWIEMNMRTVLSKLLRSVLIAMGLLTALSIAGIDLTVLSVFGGALGVGLGLGLQRLAANYVSGFVILLERSIKVGDSVRVDGFDGQVTAIRTRYTVVRALSGRESIVPNETLTSNRVENLSLADTRVTLTSMVSLPYDADVDAMQKLLTTAMASVHRVVADPAPAAHLSQFAADGLEFTLAFWIKDPENGQLNVRSEVNLAVLRALREAGIEIPYPQRVLHMARGAAQGALTAGVAPAASA